MQTNFKIADKSMKELSEMVCAFPWRNTNTEKPHTIYYPQGNGVLNHNVYPAMTAYHKCGKEVTFLLTLFLEQGCVKLPYSDIDSVHPYMDQMYLYDSTWYEFYSMGFYRPDLTIAEVATESDMYPFGYTLKLRRTTSKNAWLSKLQTVKLEKY